MSNGRFDNLSKQKEQQAQILAAERARSIQEAKAEQIRGLLVNLSGEMFKDSCDRMWSAGKKPNEDDLRHTAQACRHAAILFGETWGLVSDVTIPLLVIYPDERPTPDQVKPKAAEPPKAEPPSTVVTP